MKLAAQLYTVRALTGTADGFDGVLTRIAEIGYEGVQLSAVGCLDEIGPNRAREILRHRGLVPCATHRPWICFTDGLANEIAFHRDLGCDYAAIGVPPPLPDGEAWRGWIAELPPLLDRLAAAGIRFGYHNHDFEFRGDPTPYSMLLAEADLRLQLELDTYWAAVAGADLFEIIAAAEGRLDVVHLKDRTYAEDGSPRFAPVGEGDLPWPRLLDAFERAGTEWLVVEQDETYGRDPFEALASSHGYLRDALEVRGTLSD